MMYGLTKDMREKALQKVENQRFYLDNHFIEVGGVPVAISQFFKNSFINSDRYIAELQNRVWSLYNYAKSKNLVNVFVTLTLPSEYHPYKTLKSGRIVNNPNYINDEEHNPKNASKFLSKMFKKIIDTYVYRNIPNEQKLYFRVTEPHKSGVPHLHISFFIPKEFVNRFVKSIDDTFPDYKYKKRLSISKNRKCKIVTNVNNPVNYLMKYILKTVDDLRYTDKVTDLTLWYIYWGICRFYTSRTLISLDVYRALNGRFSLLELTRMYKDKELTILIDTKTNKISQIYDTNGLIYTKKHIRILKDIVHYDNSKPILKSKLKKDFIPVDYNGEKYILSDGKLIKSHNVPIPSKMSDYQLYNYYYSLDPDDIELNYHHFGLVQNECVKRDLIDDVPYTSLNEFNLDFEFYYENEIPFY